MVDRVFMITADDDNGDHWLFITENRDRLFAAYAEMAERYGEVTGNEAAMELLQLPAGERSN